MAEESFYGVTLSGQNSVVDWDVPNDEEYPRGQKLIIKQILLGADAAEGEFNVVEVNSVKDGVKIPIAVLKAGETRALHPDIEFYDTCLTFKLIKGNGPVYIHGTHLKDELETVGGMMDEDTDEEDEPEEDEDEAQQPKKKLKMENNSDRAKNNKKK